MKALAVGTKSFHLPYHGVTKIETLVARRAISMIGEMITVRLQRITGKTGDQCYRVVASYQGKGVSNRKHRTFRAAHKTYNSYLRTIRKASRSIMDKI